MKCESRDLSTAHEHLDGWSMKYNKECIRYKDILLRWSTPIHSCYIVKGRNPI
jgi:hypothetical protein